MSDARARSRPALKNWQRIRAGAAREPLFHFAWSGLLLFLVHGALNAPGGPDDVRTIHVDRPTLIQFLQLRNRDFDDGRARARLAALSRSELQGLITDFIREEALVREARAVRLDENDYVIRRRLAQSMEFVEANGGRDALKATDADLKIFYEIHRDRYREPPSLTFRHIFFDAQRRGWGGARLAARAAGQALSRGGAGMGAIPGDRFLYHLDYVDQGPELLASHFGSKMADALMQALVDPGRWQGPFESAHGVHWVQVREKQEGAAPSFDQVRSLVASDFAEEAAKSGQASAAERVVARYNVDVDPELRSQRAS